MTPRKRIGELLIERGAITQRALEIALQYQQRLGRGKKLGTILVEKGFITEEEMVAILAREMGVKIVDPTKRRIPEAILRYVPKIVAEGLCVIPLSKKDELLYVAMMDPSDQDVVSKLAQSTGLKTVPTIARMTLIEKAIQLWYPAEDESFEAPPEDIVANTNTFLVLREGELGAEREGSDAEDDNQNDWKLKEAVSIDPNMAHGVDPVKGFQAGAESVIDQLARQLDRLDNKVDALIRLLIQKDFIELDQLKKAYRKLTKSDPR